MPRYQSTCNVLPLLGVSTLIGLLLASPAAFASGTLNVTQNPSAVDGTNPPSTISVMNAQNNEVVEEREFTGGSENTVIPFTVDAGQYTVTAKSQEDGFVFLRTKAVTVPDGGTAEATLQSYYSQHITVGVNADDSELGGITYSVYQGNSQEPIGGLENLPMKNEELSAALPPLTYRVALNFDAQKYPNMRKSQTVKLNEANGGATMIVFNIDGSVEVTGDGSAVDDAQAPAPDPAPAPTKQTPSAATIAVHVTDTSGTPLPGARVDVYAMSNPDVPVSNATTDASGVANLTNLNDGTYRVAMTGVPSGYMQPTPQQVTLQNNGGTDVSFVLAAVGAKPDTSTDNKPISQTGGSDMTPLALAISAAAAIGIAAEKMRQRGE